jgi:hypothetical protein
MIRVSDNGIGLGPADLPRVFEMFAQVKPAHGPEEAGLGIGLALARPSWSCMAVLIEGPKRRAWQRHRHFHPCRLQLAANPDPGRFTQRALAPEVLRQ